MNTIMETINKMLKFPVSFSYRNNRYYRAVETSEYIFYVAYQESDENASAVMFRKSDKKLVSDNYFANEAMIEELENKTFTHLSKAMKYNYKEMIESKQINNA
jgi:hypothetical protein